MKASSVIVAGQGEASQIHDPMTITAWRLAKTGLTNNYRLVELSFQTVEHMAPLVC